MTENLTFTMADALPPDAVIKVVGMGGGGSNSARYIFEKGAQGVECYCVNTDVQALESVQASCTQCVQIGKRATRGLGTGGDPEKGRQAVIEDKARMASLISNTDVLFLMAGMGGGTGTGATPVIAELAMEMNILTVGVVTMPFLYENRTTIAEAGIKKLSECTDALIVLSNDKLGASESGEKTTLHAAFERINDVLYGAVTSISDLIVRSGHINVDFADVRTVLKKAGRTLIGTGMAQGPDRASKAVEQAVNNPLIDEMYPKHAQRLLVNISACSESALGFIEYQQIGTYIQKHYAASNAKIIIGTAFDVALGECIKVTVVATNFHQQPQIQAAATPTAPAFNHQLSNRRSDKFGYTKQPSLIRMAVDKKNAF